MPGRLTASSGVGLDEVEVERLRGVYERLEEATDEAAEVERRAFERWEQARGAYEVARDESDTAWRAYAAAVGG